MDYDPYLEGKSLKASFRFSSPEKLKLVLERFSTSIEDEKLDQLFRQLRGEDGD